MGGLAGLELVLFVGTFTIVWSSATLASSSSDESLRSSWISSGISDECSSLGASGAHSLEDDEFFSRTSFGEVLTPSLSSVEVSVGSSISGRLVSLVVASKAPSESDNNCSIHLGGLPGPARLFPYQ